MKKFIITEGTKVILTHFMPFDAKDGISMTEEQLLQEGYLLDEIPEPVQIDSKIPETHYSEEKGRWYEYMDALARL